MDKVSPIVFGCGAFNTTYNKDPDVGNAADVIRAAFENGITTLDTAAFYGPSEEIVGAALHEISSEYPRDSYFLCTKACRWETDEFDFSSSSVRRSVSRSLERLGTNYIDLLYIHDVEFTTEEAALEAVATAMELKREGVVKYVGFSGYPVAYLAHFANVVKDNLGTPVDAVLSYCNLTLQNNLLLTYEPKLRAAGVKLLLNASPLSMSLLRSRPTHDFHPCSKDLKARTEEIESRLAKEGLELADVASQYSFAKWKGPTVIGMRSVSEVNDAIANRSKALKAPTPELWNRIVTEFGDLHNQTWPSGLH